MIWRRSWDLRSVAWRKACLRRPASRSESWIRITVVRSHQEKSVGLLSLRTEHPQRPDKAENISGFVYESDRPGAEEVDTHRVSFSEESDESQPSRHQRYGMGSDRPKDV